MSETRPIKDYIRTIPDFPIPGVQFRDVTTLFNDATGLRQAVDALANPFTGDRLTTVAAMDARGFILGGAVAYKLGLPFVPIRKKGKLPGATVAEAYSLEYGEAIVEIHHDAFDAGARVLLVDDLLATGGTAVAGAKLIERLGGHIVAAAFVVNLPDLGGEARLRAMGIDVLTLCDFDGD
ncbi:adenine phosphoribosyltransferase [Limibaculum sp. FT325]|uniref:adenine phosphoribosyltransferase n=1 Tax=Thermohalobaculum sediminis TaxID=2939436 RepID=UPI0020BDBD71|nr:adenine phosphoribosyltransferase [Limibaculum sediminis]MCL5777668.1 adenine phosphoribosyltransferase [Limibaculum sediminis]